MPLVYVFVTSVLASHFCGRGLELPTRTGHRGFAASCYLELLTILLESLYQRLIQERWWACSESVSFFLGFGLCVPTSVCDRGKAHSGGRAGMSKRFLMPVPASQMEWVALLSPCICSKASSCFLDWQAPKICAVEVQIAVLRTQVSWQQLALISIFYRRCILWSSPVPEVCIAEQPW